MAQLDPPVVRLLYFEDCPNWRVAEARLKEALVRVGADPEAIIYEQVTTVEQAEALGFHGSPTILVDGTDPFAEPAAPAGLTCRIYRTAQGVQSAPTVEQLQAALTRRAEPMAPVPDLFDDAELSEPVARAVRRIATLGFRALWRGRSVTLTDLLGEDTPELAEATQHLRLRGRIECSDDGHLIAVHGLCRRPTPHQIEHQDGVVHTWCALDAIGIPAALGIDARARTTCPTCQNPLAVTLSAGVPRPLPDAALWYPEVACGHLVEDFCSGANLFCTIDHLERWAGGSRGPGRAMTVEEVADVGREGWADVRDLVEAGDDKG